MGTVVHVPVEGAAVSPALGVTTDRLPVVNRKVVINSEVVANLVDKDLEIMIMIKILEIYLRRQV